MKYELPPEKLRRECDPSTVSCKTTEEITPLTRIIGQERAIRALRMGIEIAEKNFNIYVAGEQGTGRMTAIKDFLDEIAKTRPTPKDWCYVNNFKNEYEPKAIGLPARKGREFQADVAHMINEVKKILPKAFETEDYAKTREGVVRTIQEEREKLFAQVSLKAQEEGFVLRSTPTEIFIIPAVKGRPLSDQEYASLSPQTRDEIEKKRQRLSADLRSAIWQLKSIEGRTSEELGKVSRETALSAIGHLLAFVTEKYKEIPEIVDYVNAVQEEILEHLNTFVGSTDEAQAALQFPWMRQLPFKKFEVNVVVDNSDVHGAPVVLETNPTYPNLFGRIEKEAQFGMLTTDFTMIRTGSLFKANGGYLVLSVEELVRNTLSWDRLKRALSSGEISVEEGGEMMGFISAKGLKPARIPLDVKVLLIGSHYIYQLLYTMDKDFKEIFKVKAEFDTTMERNAENMQAYAAFICTFVQKENLKHLDSTGVAQIIEHGSRLANDQEKLSTRFAEIADILREANFYAGQDNVDYISELQVRKAVEERTYRSGLVREKIREMIQRGFILIDTDGEAVGQVNGLSVLSLGDLAFGSPSRLTASVGLGRDGIIDIEREAMMSGPIHTKGVMILGGYLQEKYAKDRPLTLSARLVFEQSYEGVEGDSASSTELYALISALSGIPIGQNVAVTGSVNQKGDVQAIGGVNEKIEGFFELCNTKGLTGTQGVMIPESNVKNLMLKEAIVDAVKDGRFHIYSVGSIDEGIEILMGIKAGAKLPNGRFEEGTVHNAVDRRLQEMAERLKEFPEYISGRPKA